MHRDYRAIVEDVRRRTIRAADRQHRMQAVVDCLWERLHAGGVSWVGFYLKSPDSDEMLLGPRRDKPACSPIGLHGACGRAFIEDRPFVVRDVAELGQNYIACDPRDRSEAVIPFHHGGAPAGVLDLDSHEFGSFDETDVTGLVEVLRAAGLEEPFGATTMVKHSPRFLALVCDVKKRIRECTVADVQARRQRRDRFHLVDVRDESEYAAGHLPGAVHMSKGTIERDIEEAIPNLDADIVLYCGGGYRSALAADNLQKMGYRCVVSMDGGWRGWREAGLPTE